MRCWDSTYATKSQDLHALNHETCTNMGSDHENARHLPCYPTESSVVLGIEPSNGGYNCQTFSTFAKLSEA